MTTCADIASQEFSVLVYCPAGLGPPALAAAAARAGGVGILDLASCPPDRMPHALDQAGLLADQAGPEQALGLRIRPDQIDLLANLPGSWQTGTRWLVLALDGGPEADPGRCAVWADKFRLLIEVSGPGQAQAAVEALPGLHGVIGVGTEAGGWGGRESAFVLAQRLGAWSGAPFLVRGGLGPYAAAACRAAGAAGMVLDDAALLLPGSPLEPAWRAELKRAAGQDARDLSLGGSLSCRALARPGLPVALELAQRAERDEPAGAQELAKGLAWGNPERWAWPVGQGVHLAAMLYRRYGTLGRLVAAARQAAEQGPADALDLGLLAEGSPLAREHGTRLPLVQGPMAQVSDNPDFALAVSSAGALPMMALSLLDGPRVAQLLDATARVLGDRPWGVGLMGFVEPELWEAQLAEVSRVRPPFAVISGGRPDQVARLEQAGTKAYLHAPTPELAALFLEQGARRLILEGWECGGHVGPLTSFVLWEGVAHLLADRVRGGETGELRLLLAGGVHDARSAAMAAAMIAPLARRGALIGLQMGTAYLFCEQAVSSGALRRKYQEELQQASETWVLPLGPGHANRVCPSPFARDFLAKRREWRNQGLDAAETSRRLEELCRGRLRLAAKGENAGQVQGQDMGQDMGQGMFLSGQTAAQRRETTTLERLHAEVGTEAIARLRTLRGPARPGPETTVKPLPPVAIIGMALFLPGASDPDSFWGNILAGRQSISEVPRHYFDWRLYQGADGNDRSLISSHWGGFIDEVAFDPISYGIPPRSVASISVGQLLALEAVRRALGDAGLEHGGFDRERAAVIFGAAQAGGMVDVHHNTRMASPLVMGGLPPEAAERLANLDEESFPGILDNVVAGRIANRFDLGGPNFTMDGACATTLHVLDAALKELATGRSDLVVAGGVEVGQNPVAYAYFSQVQALSPTGQVRAFDRRANGTVTSEGAVAVILKRLDDARRDGDRIYAVIRAVGSSSDGRALSLTAPLPRGQRRALDRAYGQAGFSPADLGFLEAHATGTRVGDQAEVRTIVDALSQAGTPAGGCVVGSVKSLIGHAKVAAGLAGVVKAALALHHQVLPPQPGVDEPLADLAGPDSPAVLLREPSPWLAAGDQPRRAGVSAFGFGGTNAHAVLEEYHDPLAVPPVGARDWPAELVVLKAANLASLAGRARRLSGALETAPEVKLRDLAYTLAVEAAGNPGPAVLALVCQDLSALREKLRLAVEHLSQDAPRGASPHGLILGQGEQADAGLAFLFPGQGSQRPGMAREAALYLPEIRASLEQADRALAGRYPAPLSRYILPPQALGAEEEKAQARRLADPHLTQPAVGAVSAGFLDLLRRLGMEPVMTAGHSYGEYTALHAAGALDRTSLLDISEQRGRAMSRASSGQGTMAALRASGQEAARWLEGFDGLVIANYNAPDQTVVSGPKRQVERLVGHLRAEGVDCILLPVGGAFHSPLMEPANQELARALGGLDLTAPGLTVYANVSGRPHPGKAEAIRDSLLSHLLSPVRFADQVEAMYADGARVFLEVGPGAVLSGLVGRILGDRPHLALAVQGRGGGLRGLLDCLGRLAAAGVGFDLTALYQGRPVEMLDLESLSEGSTQAASSTAWLVDGVCARPAGEPAGRLGAKPAFDLESAAGRVPPLALPAAAEPLQADLTGLEPAEREVVAAFLAQQQTLRRMLADQEQALLGLLRDGDTPAPTQAPPHPEPEPVAPPEPETEPETAAVPVLDREGVIALLQQLISQRTGYPREMLAPDLDLEAELGVDSIKRVEVLGELRRRLPPQMGLRVQEMGEQLSRCRTLTTLADTLLRDAPPMEAEIPDEPPVMVEVDREDEPLTLDEPISDQSPAAETDGDPEVGSCPRLVMRPMPEPIFDLGSDDAAGLYLVTQDLMGVCDPLCRELAGRGATVRVLERTDLASSEDLARRVRELCQGQGPVRGIVHLASLGGADTPDLAAWRRETAIQTKSLFHLLRLCRADLTRPDETRMSRVLAATAQGGWFGRDNAASPHPPAGGGCQGILRTLDKEWAPVLAKAVDLPLDGDPERLAKVLTRELMWLGGELEVGYPDFRRRVFQTVERPLKPGRAGLEPSSDWVVLATGGARGITARCLATLVRPGMRLVLVGSSSAPESEPPELAALKGEAELRAALIARSAAQGEGATPARIEAHLRRILSQRQMRANLAEFSRLGALVEYHTRDVRDGAALAGLLDEVYRRHGRLDAVLHGAGVIEDRLIEDKEEAGFDLVFDTKLDAAFTLARALKPETLKLLVFFASVSGRFGNRGQADYAAANEGLNRLAWWLAGRWPQARVVSINWGPWEGPGMAGQEVARLLARRGMGLIPPTVGAEFFRREVLWGGRGQAEVIAGQGPWQADWPHAGLAHPDLAMLAGAMAE